MLHFYKTRISSATFMLEKMKFIFNFAILLALVAAAENQENENDKKRLYEDFFEFEKSKVLQFLKPKRSSFRKKKNK